MGGMIDAGHHTRPVTIGRKVRGTIATSARCTMTKATMPAMARKWTRRPVQKLLGVTLAIAVRGDAALFTALWIPGAVLLPILASWWLHERIELPGQRYGRGMALAAVTAG
jgi:hypothetical protein